MRTMKPPPLPRVDLDELTPEELAGLDERSFREVVNADLKRTASNERLRTRVPDWIVEALRSTHVDRWVATLRGMAESVEHQLELREREAMARSAQQREELKLRMAAIDREAINRKAELEEEAARVQMQLERQVHDSLVGTLRFRSEIQTILPEAEVMLDRTVYDLTERLQDVESAVETHRSMTLADDSIEPSEADRLLWSILND